MVNLHSKVGNSEGLIGTTEEMGLLQWSSVCLIFKNSPKLFTVEIGLGVQRVKGLLSLGSTVTQRRWEGKEG